MEIQKVTDAAFRAYGKVLEGYDFSELLLTLLQKAHRPHHPSDKAAAPSP